MKRLMLLTSLFTCTVFAQTLSQEEKLSDFNQLISAMRASYGPLNYKREALNIDLNTQINKFDEKIRNSQSNGEFYYLINEFIASFQDGHFGASIPSSRRAELPFSTDLVDGRVVIDEVFRLKKGGLEFPFAKGDEIVEFNSREISDELQKIAKFITTGNDKGRLRTAAMMLSIRVASVLPVPRESEVVLGVRRLGSSLTETYRLNWIYSGRELDEAYGLFNNTAGSVSRTNQHNPMNLSIQENYLELFGKERMERSFRCSGSTRISIPDDAEILLMDPFVAYTYPTEAGQVGYLRIPHYFPTNQITGAFEFSERIQQYAYVIEVLERTTIGLIIDQDHNCGGSVGWLEEMVSLFMDEFFPPLQFSYRASKPEFLTWQSYAQWAPLPSLARDVYTSIANLVWSSWTKGDFLTPKTSFRGQDALVNPWQGTRYSKPVVILIDEMAGSGGDAFPAMMQGYGRAKLLGSTTAGLGGHVTEQAPLMNSGIRLRMTRSLFYRPSGVPIENNGAEPDYPYTHTRADFMYGYQEYRQFYTQKLLELISQN